MAAQQHSTSATLGLCRMLAAEADGRARIVETPHEILKVAHG
jgi:hypothetical protein